jgi:bifunctional non-homologous end joining protein LigD
MVHEIKHNGYRLIVQREGKRVRLWTRNGHVPLVSEAALRNRNSSFVLDGEAVLLGVDGGAHFAERDFLRVVGGHIARVP